MGAIYNLRLTDEEVTLLNHALDEYECVDDFEETQM